MSHRLLSLSLSIAAALASIACSSAPAPADMPHDPALAAQPAAATSLREASCGLQRFEIMLSCLNTTPDSREPAPLYWWDGQGQCRSEVRCIAFAREPLYATQAACETAHSHCR